MTKTKMEAGDCIMNTESRIESLPSCFLMEEILLKLDLENLCTLSCVSTMFRTSASQAVALLPSLNLSGFSPDMATLKIILPKCKSIKTLTLNCIRVDDNECISSLLYPSIEELNLLCCFFFDPEALNGIGENCPNLRSFMLELDYCEDGFTECLKEMLIKCGKLESFQLKIRGGSFPDFDFINLLPSTIKSLKLEPLIEDEAVELVCGTNPSASTTLIKANFLQTLQNLSLVLDVIFDKLVLSIIKCIPNLLELHLKDRPEKDPTPSKDLTNVGLQSLGTCRRLQSLSLARSNSYCQTSFRRVNDMGILLLSEGCVNLESVTLSGFSGVTDAGFASILHSCPKLKKFKVRNAALLSDLTFYSFSHIASPLEEVKLVSCYNITSDTLMKLATKSNLELLDLHGCWSVSDTGINSITSLNKLVSLNLAGADITDTALSVLSQCSSPIKSLSLRGCRGVTDEGIVTLFHEGTLAKTLTTLDLSEICGITDVAVEAVAFAGTAVTELSIKVCINLTDSSIRALARKGQLDDGKSLPLKKLDISACIGLTAASLGLFKKPGFRGLWWLGVGGTVLDQRGSDAFKDVLMERPWLTVCSDGCEMGCYDGWNSYDHHMHILGQPDPV